MIYNLNIMCLCSDSVKSLAQLNPRTGPQQRFQSAPAPQFNPRFRNYGPSLPPPHVGPAYILRGAHVRPGPRPQPRQTNGSAHLANPHVPNPRAATNRPHRSSQSSDDDKRSASCTRELRVRMVEFFPDNVEVIDRVLKNHGTELDLNRLVNYVTDALI